MKKEESKNTESLPAKKTVKPFEAQIVSTGTPKQVGKTNNPDGRPLGSPNKVTTQTRALVQSIVENNIEKINTELEALHGKPYLDAMVSIMEFALPKLQRTELSGADGQGVEVKQLFIIGGQEIQF